MRKLVQILAILVLLSVELYAAYAVLHPRVSAEYRAFFIDRSTKDWNPTHYPATPEQGIQFIQQGWPTFVRSSSGFSAVEPWGRWTDADLTPAPKIFMTRQFSGPLCIEFEAQPSYAERGTPVQVAFGQNTAGISLSNPEYTTYRVSFANASPADTLEFRFPETIPPNNELIRSSPDGRRLGMRFLSLRILPHQCWDH